MLDDNFVIDAVGHTYNMDPSNFRVDRYSRAVSENIWGVCNHVLSPPGYRLKPEDWLRDWDVEEMAKMIFLESDADLCVHHVLRINLYHDGLVSFDKTKEVLERWPERFIVYAGVDPTRPETMIDELEEQIEALNHPLGLKLYPNGFAEDGYVGWRMDDAKMMYPLYERARQAGIKVIAIHKALPLGGAPMEYYAVGDLDRAADDFPDLNFEVVHAGMAFIEDSAWQMARYPNVYANLEGTAGLLPRSPALFARGLAGLAMIGGEDVLKKVFYGSGAMAFHPWPALKLLAEFEFPPEIIAGTSVPQLRPELRRGILGENYAQMIGLDVAAARERIADDEFARARKELGGRAEPYSTTKVTGRAH